MRKHSSTNYERAQDGEPIYRADGIVIGCVVGNEYRKAIHDNHFLKKPQAIASDVQSLLDAQAAGAIWFVAYHVEGKKEYRAPIARFFGRGIKVNRGHNPQLALMLSEFGDAATTVKPSQPSLFNLSHLLRR